MRTASARCIQGRAASTADADSAVPFHARHIRVPMVSGAFCGAISTGRPLSNSTACSASDDETSSPASGCGTTVTSARRACCATKSSSRPVMVAKLAVAVCDLKWPGPSTTSWAATNRSNMAWTAWARSVLSFSVADIISSIIAPDRPSPASGATSRLSTRTCSAVTCAFQILATINAVDKAASPAAVPVSGSSNLRMAMSPSCLVGTV